MSEVKTTNKKIITPKPHSTRQMYGLYSTKNPVTKVPYWMFKEVLARYNRKASDAIIFGQVLNLGSKLGYLLIRKINRNYQKPVVDWGESKRVRKEILDVGGIPKSDEHPDGQDWLIYFSDPWYLRWGWLKKRICKVRNQTVYKFTPTANRSRTAGDTSLTKLGNKGKLTLMNKINPSLHLAYEQPYKKRED